MTSAGVPAAETMPIARPPCVIKADGLAGGKGVFVCRTEDELERGLRATASLGSAVLIEELLEGEELSVFALCDGARAVPLAAARDYKRVGDGDTGANTGGMGSYSPVPGVGAEELEKLVEHVHRPVIGELAERGAPFQGVLFDGLMVTNAGPRVLAFNWRCGDP